MEEYAMAAGESALIPLSPDDTLDAIADRIRGAGTAHVQLLVPDGTAALQTLGGFQRLLQKIAPDRVGLLLITSDEKTLNAARLSQVETVGVQGARVSPPAKRGPAPAQVTSADRYATQAFAAGPIDQRDAEFLDALDQVPSGDRYADLQRDDADLYSALDDLSDTFQQDASGRRAEASAAAARRDLSGDEDFAAALDEWPDFDAASAPTRPDRDRDLDPPRRFSAADFDLAEDAGRQRGGRRSTGAQRARAEAKLATSGVTTARRPRAAASDRLRDYDEDEEPAPRRSRSWAFIPLVAILVLGLALALWFLSSRTTISIAPPASAASEQPFANEVIPLAQPGENSNAAVEAAPVSAGAEATVTGQIQKETLSPVGTAKGEITIINTIGSAVPIPRSSEFIGKNSVGQEVRFSLDSDVTVPGATSSSSLSGSSTTYGQLAVSVTARSPGSASNVDVNSVTQLLIPGQQPIVSQSSNFIFQNAPIGGGTEESQKIVTEADVQAVLGQALTALYANGIQALRSQIDETRVAIDATTIAPSAETLGDPKNYDPPLVEPAIGQAVDPSNPVFKVTVRANFNALATPSGRSVADQLQTVAPQYFFQRSDRPCKTGERQGTRVDAARWDGEKLTIDAVITCTPIGGLPPETIGKIRDAVRGQSRDAAATGLETLKQEGLIGDYQLPDRAQFPRFDWLITIQPTESQPPQPTQGTQP